MLSPKNIWQLENAIELILAPYDSMPTNPTISIKKGQCLLNTLRQIPDYQTLLSYCLQKYLQQSENNAYVNEISFNQSTLTNKRLQLILLQLLKLSPLKNEATWWNLLQFYYKCSQCLQKFVLEIIKKHLLFGQKGDYFAVYQQFLNPRNWKSNSITSSIKMLTINCLAITTLQNTKPSSQYEVQWKLQQIRLLIIKLQQSVHFMGQNHSMINYIAICIIYLICMLRTTSDQSLNNDNIQFINDRLIRLNEAVNHMQNIKPCSILLIALLNNGFGFGQQPAHKYQMCIDQNLQQCLRVLIRTRKQKHREMRMSMKSLSYMLTGFQNNRMVLLKNLSLILKVYQDYIDKVQLRKPIQQLFHCQKQQIISEQQLQDDFELSQTDRYYILEICLQCSINNIIDVSSMSIIKFQAFVPKVVNATNETVNAILAYFNSVTHHHYSDCKITLIASLKYLFRFALQNPNFSIIQISMSLLNLRTSFQDLYQVCDYILAKITPILITCAQEAELSNFLQIWVSSLQRNYMNNTSLSYYPILVILDNTDYNFTLSINYLSVLATSLQLLTQEPKKQNLLNCYYYYETKTKDYSIHQIFYKWSDVMVKYLIMSNRGNQKWLKTTKINQQNSNQRTTNLIHKKQQHHLLSQTLNRCIKFLFQNQLYSVSTAYIYLIQIINKNIYSTTDDNESTMQFLNNLQLYEFWKGLDKTQIMFYGCVLAGLINYFISDIQTINGYINDFFTNILYLVKQNRLQQQEIDFLINGLQQFSILIEQPLHLSQWKKRLSSQRFENNVNTMLYQ